MTEFRVVAKTVVVNAEGKVLLLRRSTSDSRRPLQWDIPGGHTDDGEFAEEAAVRETAEEAGITLDVRKLRAVYGTHKYVDDESLNVVWFFFACQTEDATVQLSDEHDEYRWVTLDEAVDLIEYERQKAVLIYVRDHSLLESLRA